MKKTFISLALAALIFSGCGAQAKDIGADKAKEIAISHAGRRSRTTPRFPRHREMRAFVSCMA